jgi:hypothetical protein
MTGSPHRPIDRHLIPPSAPVVFILVLMAWAASSCGDPRDPDPGGDIGVTAEELLGTNISGSLVPNSTFQSETSAVATGNMAAIAYNTDDTAHGIANVSKCRFHSQIALSYRSPTGGAWRVVHVPVPSSQGVSVLRGDPSVAFLDVGGSYRVFVASLAISDATWNTLPKRSDGCVDNANIVGAGFLDRACVAAVEIPKDGSAAFPGLAFCFAPLLSGGHFDGGSVTTTAAGFVYATYWDKNSTSSRVDVFRTNDQAFSALPNPFPGTSILGHSIFVKNASAPSLIAPDSTGTFWYTSLDETTLTWSLPAVVATGFSWQRNLTMQRSSTILRERGYTEPTWVSNGPSRPSLYFFYSKPASGALTRIQGVVCSVTNVFGCSEVPGWGTSNLVNSFMVAMTVAIVPQPPSPFPRVAPWISYWSEVRTDGNLTLNWARVNGDGTLTAFADSRAVEGACPAGKYWGDYDTMTVENDLTAGAGLLRPFTDSTSAGCTANGDPQHVSLLRLAP